MYYGKQAKVLSPQQVNQTLAYLAGNGRNRQRNRVMFLLSLKGALRAKEIANLKWRSVTNSEGQIDEVMTVETVTSKGRYSGGKVPIASDLRDALAVLLSETKNKDGYVVTSERGERLSAQAVTNWFFNLYKSLGIDGASGHSGRRTAITRAARLISQVGGSLRDVQAFARHSSIAATQRYIEINDKAIAVVVDKI